MKRRAKAHTEEEVAHEPSNRPFYQTERFWGVVIAAILLIAAMGTAISLRLATVDLELADRWAQDSVRQQGVNQFSALVRQQYPTLPDANVQAEAQKRWNAYAAQNADIITQQEEMLAQELRSFFQFETGNEKKYNQTYVLEMDPYHFWHKSVNYANHGSVCDEGMPQLENGACIDKYRLAPLGTEEGYFMHIAFEAWLIKTVGMFNDNLDTLTIVFFVPVILAALSTIPAFFIGRRLAGNVGGFVAAMIVAVHPVLMNRTIAGFADTDGYIFMFSLFVVWFLLEALTARRWWTRLLFAALAGLSIGFFSFSWTGWWFVFFVLMVALIAIIIYKAAVFVKSHESRKAYKDLLPLLAVVGMFFLASAIFGSMYAGTTDFIRSFTAPFTATTNLQSATVVGDLTGWPNILTTVAELNIPSLSAIISNLGGKMIVVFAAFGLFALLISPKNLDWKRTLFAIVAFLYYFVLISKGLALSPITFIILFSIPLVAFMLYTFLAEIPLPNLAASIIMMAWLLAVLFATTKGIRFLLIGIPPFAIGFGIAVGWIFTAITHAIIDGSRNFKRIAITNVAVGVILLLVIFNPVAGYSPLASGKAAAGGQLPGMNDAWWGVLAVVREQTAPNTIITSWWDFGHWFRNIGNRPVTFDGGSQNPEPGHFVGKILLSNNENQALGILRMLDCGQNTAYEIAHQHLDVIPAKDLVDELVLLNKTGAQRRLSRTDIPIEDQARILNVTHCTPPPAVFITSSDMVGKSGVWGHFGSWDFRRAMVYHYYSTLPQAEAIAKIETMNFTSAQANEMYFTLKSFNSDGQANSWISGWPNYMTQWQGCTVTNGTATCPTSVGIGQTQQGLLVIEGVQFNVSTPERMNIGYGAYNNGVRLGGNVGRPAKVTVANVDTGRITSQSFDGAEFTVGVLVRKSGSEYAILLADPLQVDSLFTQLYFLDGAFTPHFTKLVEAQELGGGKIIVWNVTWPQQ